MAKLTLSIDESVVAQAKEYARAHGVSVSAMVEAYLSSLRKPHGAPATPPVLRSLRGILKEADVQDYRRHLARKYR